MGLSTDRWVGLRTDRLRVLGGLGVRTERWVGLRRTDHWVGLRTDRLVVLWGLGVGLQAADQGDIVPGLSLQDPIAQNSLHEGPLFLDRHLVHDALEAERRRRMLKTTVRKQIIYVFSWLAHGPTGCLYRVMLGQSGPTGLHGTTGLNGPTWTYKDGVLLDLPRQ